MIIPHPKAHNGGYYMEKMLFDNISVLPKRIAKDKDVLGVFVGSPGEGKSTLCQQVMYLLDNTLNINNVLWDSDNYIRYCTGLWLKGGESPKLTEGKAVIHDEGKRDMSALSILTKKTRNYMDFLYENRQMRMYQAFLTGDFFDIPKSIVMNRIMFVIWVHEAGEFENGHFKFFNREDTRLLYIKGKKERNMNASNYSFRGTFPKFYTVDEDEYRKVKARFLRLDRFVKDEDEKELTATQIIKWIINKNPNVRVSEVCRVLGISDSMYYKVKDKVIEDVDEIKVENNAHLQLLNKIYTRG